MITIFRITADGNGIYGPPRFFEDRAEALAYLAENMTDNMRVYFSPRRGMTETSICKRCGSRNMRVENYVGSIFYGWWVCMDCGNVGVKRRLIQ